MKKIIVFLFLIGCAKNGTDGVNGARGPQGPDGTPGVEGPQGPQGSQGDAAPTSVPTPQPVDFNGFFVLPNNSYVEVVTDSGLLNDLNQVRLVYQNVDLSYGLVPLSSTNNLPKQNDSLYLASNLNYIAGNNVKTDTGNVVLVGSFFTMLTFTKVNGKLNVRVQISSGATIVFDHILVQE